MEIKTLQRKIDEWIQTVGQRYFDPLTNTALLAEETGEVARLMARIYGEQSFKKEKSADQVQQQLSEELADLMFVLVCIANQTNVDLEKAMEETLRKKTARDSDRHRNNPKLI